MVWMFIAAVAASLWLEARSLFERNVFTTDEYELKSDKVSKEHTFVFLTDLHNKWFGPGQRRLLAAIDRVRPDAVLIGGDMIIAGEKAETAPALFFIKKLAARYPVYYGNGNHEYRLDRDRWRYGDRYDRYREELTAAGVVWLSDESAVVDGEVRISGLNLEKRCYRPRGRERMEPSYITAHLGEADPRRYQILLAHTPKHFDAYSAWGADLTLSGHYHGGTVWIPFAGGLMTPQYEFFQKNCQGVHKKDGRIMIVGRGLGTHTVNLRLNDRAQLMVVKIRPGGRKQTVGGSVHSRDE